jgi:c-di-GMP-binding flagellar brake protein YcgR
MNSPNVESPDKDVTAQDRGRDETQISDEAASNALPETFAFEAMNLKVGDRLQVQPPTTVSTDRSPVKLIGYLQDQSMLITAPTTADGVPMQLMPRDQLIMRVFSGQNAFGFACDVQRVCRLPYGYLHTSFPKKIQGTVIRKAARVKTKIIVKVRVESSDAAEHTAVISNLSANGALLDGRRTMAQEGDTLRISFKLKLHNIEAELSLACLVRTVFDDEALKQSGTTLAHFGVQFVELEPNDQMLLQSMVYQHMIEKPQSVV